MENYWGRLKEPQKVSLENSKTKSAIRQRVWEFLERNDLANFPRPVYNRIPNFKGASRAAANLTEQLPEFRDAKTIKVNPDKPQEEVRFKVLEAGKTLMVPTPRLSQGLFNRLEPDPSDSSKDKLRQLASRHGIDNMSKPIPMASRIRLDMVVIGSVAVDRLGHRIGKGEGFADLEFAMAASHHSAITDDTLVVTTVHDCQVFDQLPADIFESHDLSVDVIVTPTEVFRVSERLKKPEGIQWSLLSREKFDQIPILKEIQYKEMKNGKDTRLKGETHQQNFNGGNNHHHHSKKETSHDGNKESSMGSEGNSVNTGSRAANKNGPGGNQGKKSNNYPKRNNSNAKNHQNKKSANEKSVENGDAPSTVQDNSQKTKKDSEKEGKEGKPQQQKPQQKKSNPGHSHHGVFVGRIPRQARTKDLRDAVLERGLKPATISWKGVKGFAFIYFDIKTNGLANGDDLMEKLKDLKIGETLLNVEQDKRSNKNKNKSESVADTEVNNGGSIHESNNVKDDVGRD